MHQPLKSFYPPNSFYKVKNRIEENQSYYRVIVVIVMFITLRVQSPAQDLIQRTLQAPENQSQTKSSVKTTSLFQIAKSFKSSKYSNYTDHAIYLNYDVNSVDRIMKSNNPELVISIPVSTDRSFDVILEEVEVLAPGYYTETSDGRIIYPDRSKIKIMKGRVSDDPSSIASVTIMNGQLKAIFSDAWGNYVLGELPGENSIYTLYNDQTLKIINQYECGTEQSFHEIQNPNSNRKYDIESQNNGSECVSIYVEADYETYQSHNSSVQNVTDYIIDLVAQSAIIYDNNTGTAGASRSISTVLASSFVWTSADPFANTFSTLQILEDFGEFRQDNVDGRLKHFISTRGLGGGVAWIGVLCDDYFTFWADWDGNGVNELHHAGPYAVSAGLNTSFNSYPVYSWDVEVFAHEMGHNFGSPHTHNCSWDGGAIDGCGPAAGYSEGCNADLPPPGGGTVMSYCHLLGGVGINLANGFGEQPGQLLYDQLTSCGNSRPNDFECVDPDIEGCMDVLAHNFSPEATIDDGSCETCNDNILNGDEAGIDCGGILCDPCQGCIDTNAHNYDLIATVDDGSCETCDDGQLNGDEQYIDCGGSRCTPCITGCDTDTDAYNYVPDADIHETCETCFDGILNGDEQAVDCGGSYLGCPTCITGCMEVFASNYEPNADFAGVCNYDCDASTTSIIDESNKNKVIISNANTLKTEMPSDIEVDTSIPLFWRAKQTIELNHGFSIMAGTELTIDPGDCEDN